MIWRVLILLLLTVCPALASSPQKGCGAQDDPCGVGDRSYHVKEPDGWDGASPLPVLLHFHGWMRTGALPIKHQRISGATRRRGVLLIAPNGNGRTWNFWNASTEDVPFAREVLEDVAKRYPIDLDKVFVSGYSYGSAMAWRFVCEDGADVAALVAVSGTLRQSETCATAPREVRHVHGLADTVMDFPMGPGGDATYPVKLWRDTYDCGDPTPKGTWQAVNFLTFERTTWEDCNGAKVTLDLHPGGHFIPHGWIARQLDELLERTPSYP
ncbi:MAG: PHB depolymerase family esterase [Sedimentitalea sp.]